MAAWMNLGQNAGTNHLSWKWVREFFDLAVIQHIDALLPLSQGDGIAGAA
jgi:hypothetical protein